MQKGPLTHLLFTSFTALAFITITVAVVSVFFTRLLTIQIGMIIFALICTGLIYVILVRRGLRRLAALERHASTLERQVAEQTQEAERRAEETARLAEIGQRRARELEELARQAQAAAGVAQAAGSILEMEELLQRNVELIYTRFDLYYVGLFLLTEDGEAAELRAAAGNGSDQLLSERQQLQVQGNSMIARAIRNGRTLVAPDAEKEPLRFRNPMLPKTHSEITLPLIIRGEAIGAITVQSEEIDAFTPSGITILETMAGQIANAIGNVRLYQELQEEKQSADSANRTKSVFLANMSHEIRTPLNAILGFTDVLRFDSTLTAEQREYVLIIHRSSQNLLTLINGILDLAKIEAGRMTLNEQVFSIPSLLQNIEERLHLQVEEKDLEMVFDIPLDLPAVMYGDEVKLRQVLINLLANAVRYTEQGCVTLHLRRAEPDEIKELPAPRSASPLFLRFSIRDTGTGLQTEDIEHIFDPFAPSPGGKTGQRGSELDLAISRQFVSMMGGNLKVESTPGSGTEFTFIIALSVENAFQTGPTPAMEIAHLAPDQAIPRLLAVDNQQESRQWTVWLLTMMGFEVRQAVSGAEALQICRFYRPDLILMDMDSPPGEGFAAVQQLKASPECRGARIIGLTHQTGERERAEMITAGCDNILSKTFQSQDLAPVLEKLLNLKFSIDTIPEPILSGRLATRYTHNAQFDLQSLAPEWVEKFSQAAQTADFEVVFDLIGRIRSQQPELCDYLSKLANNFDLRGLQALLPETGPGIQAGQGNQS